MTTETFQPAWPLVNHDLPRSTRARIGSLCQRRFRTGHSLRVLGLRGVSCSSGKVPGSSTERHEGKQNSQFLRQRFCLHFKQRARSKLYSRSSTHAQHGGLSSSLDAASREVGWQTAHIWLQNLLQASDQVSPPSESICLIDWRLISVVETWLLQPGFARAIKRFTGLQSAALPASVQPILLLYSLRCSCMLRFALTCRLCDRSQRLCEQD